MELSLQPFPIWLAAAAIVLALGLLLRRGRGGGRRYHPVAGTVLEQLLHFGRLYHYQTEVSRRYRTFRLLTPFNSEIYTTDPAVIEHVLRTNFHKYGKGRYNYEIIWDLFGDGIFAVDGGEWRHQRKLASYEFSTRALRDYSGTIFKKNATKLATAVSEAADTHMSIDVQDWFMKSTMDSIFEVAFGIQLNCLRGSNGDGADFVRAFDESNAQIMWRYFNPLWRIARFLNIGSEATLKKNIKRVDDYVYKLIRSKIAQMNSHMQEEHSHVGSAADDDLSSSDLGASGARAVAWPLQVKKADILSRFLLESERDPKNMNHKYLRDIILNFVIAGKDTTAGTLSWFFYMLCKHPSVQEKIAREVEQAVRDGETAASFEEFAARITEDALEKMQYLHAALSETLRLYPAVPLDAKVCFSDDTLPDGCDVRRGQVITYQPYVMGRMEYLWGEDAEVFRPERWLDANGAFCPQCPFKFTAFQAYDDHKGHLMHFSISAGPRLCLGREFAYRQMKIFAAVLLRFFVFKLSDEKKVVEYKTMLTLHIDQGLRLHAFQR